MIEIYQELDTLAYVVPILVQNCKNLRKICRPMFPCTPAMQDYWLFSFNRLLSHDQKSNSLRKSSKWWRLEHHFELYFKLNGSAKYTLVRLRISGIRFRRNTECFCLCKQFCNYTFKTVSKIIPRKLFRAFLPRQEHISLFCSRFAYSFRSVYKRQKTG